MCYNVISCCRVFGCCPFWPQSGNISDHLIILLKILCNFNIKHEKAQKKEIKNLTFQTIVTKQQVSAFVITFLPYLFYSFGVFLSK